MYASGKFTGQEFYGQFMWFLPKLKNVLSNQNLNINNISQFSDASRYLCRYRVHRGCDCYHNLTQMFQFLRRCFNLATKSEVTPGRRDAILRPTQRVAGLWATWCTAWHALCHARLVADPKMDME